MSDTRRDVTATHNSNVSSVLPSVLRDMVDLNCNRVDITLERLKSYLNECEIVSSETLRRCGRTKQLYCRIHRGRDTFGWNI